MNGDEVVKILWILTGALAVVVPVAPERYLDALGEFFGPDASWQE